MLQFIALALFVRTHAQTQNHLFSLLPTTPWAATVPTIGGQILSGVFTNNFAFSVNSSNGAVTMLSNHTNPQFSFSSINAQINEAPPYIGLSGTNCTTRQFTVTFAYTIPNTFYDLCAFDGAGMEAFFVLGSSQATATVPQGLGGAMTGGANLIVQNASNPKPWQFFSPTSRAYYFAPPVYCDFNMGTECQFQLLNIPQFYYGMYKTVTTITVDVATTYMLVTGMESYYNGTKLQTLNSTTAVNWPLVGGFWLGRWPPLGTIPLPFIYIMETCLDVIVNTFDIDYTDICQTYSNPPPSGGGPATAPTSGSTTLRPTPAPTPVMQTTRPTTVQQTQTSPSISTTSDTTQHAREFSSSESLSTTLESLSTESSTHTAANGTDTAVAATPASSPVFTQTPVEQLMSLMMSNNKGGMNTIIFSVVGVAICCLFSLFMCCMFRKPIRRNDYVRRAYLATPGRRFLCRCLGSEMESEASRGERLLSVSSSPAASYLKDT